MAPTLHPKRPANNRAIGNNKKGGQRKLAFFALYSALERKFSDADDGGARYRYRQKNYDQELFCFIRPGSVRDSLRVHEDAAANHVASRRESAINRGEWVAKSG